MLVAYEKPTEKFVESVKKGIEKEVGKANEKDTVAKGKYFLKWVLTRVFNATDDDAGIGILDGANDHGIDAILEVQGSEFNFFRIFQSKYGTSHKPDEIIKFRAMIDEFLKQNPNDLPQGRMRDTLIDIKKKGWDVEAVYVTDQQVDFKSEENFQVYGFERIVRKMWDDISEPAEGKTEEITLEDSMKFDDTIIGVISLSELGRLVLRSKKYIFESNIRKFLPVKTRVNKNLRDTLLKEPQEVFYYNNGITMVVKKVEELGDGKHKLFAPQIVNGAQTSSTIADIVRGDPNIIGNVQITIITEDSRTTRNNITKYRNSQNAVKGRDLISLERFHESISGQLKVNLGYYYELQAGSWGAMSDAERDSYKGDEVFNNYLPEDHEMRIPANDAIQVMATVITRDPAKPYGSISKFLPGGTGYEKIFKEEGLEKEDDYRLLLYPYLVKSFAEKEFNYGNQKANMDEKKYARLLFVTAYFIALQDYVMTTKTNIRENPKSLDPYFNNYDANKKLLILTDEILNQFFDLTNHIRQDEDGRDKMTLHNFFARHVWSSDAKTSLKNIMNRMRKDKFQEIREEFEK